MQVTYFGHACLKASGNGRDHCLMDPWFSREGAFFRSWFQFPENAPLLDRALEGVTDICVSHNHADHFDPPVLRRALGAEPGRRLHIARFATPWFKNRARAALGELADRLVEHEPFTPFAAAGGLEVYFVPEESPGQIDSAIVCQGDGHLLVNLNDARLNTDQLIAIRDSGPRVGLLALQASGASEYPINYLYPPADMEARKVEKRATKFLACERVIDLFEPERALFFAGPPVFLDPRLAVFNDAGPTSVFPDQLDIARHYAAARPDIAARTLFALPGEDLVDARLWSRTDMAEARLAPYTRKADYIVAYRQRRPDVLHFDAGEPPPEAALIGHFERMARVSRHIARKINGEITFVIRGRTREVRYTVDFATRTARPGDGVRPLYVLTAPASAVAAVLADEATWDDIFLSLRMTFDERSERFVSHFKTLLKYMDRDILAALGRYETRLKRRAQSETFELEHDGRRYRLQRFCPHAGVDLQRHGHVNPDGSITCAAHRFCYDLESGRCLNAEGYELKVQRLA